MKATIKIDVISDIVCPWCYIGKRRLETAVEKLSDKYSFEITYHPFELNPNTPVGGVQQKKHLSEKFGSEDHYEKITGHTAQVAAEDGLLMHFEKQLVLPNTRKAHSVILAAKQSGKQFSVVEYLFKAYFTDGIDLSRDENLIEVCVGAGLDRGFVEECLDSTELMTKIAKHESELQQMDIRGVPFYIINDEYGISGAQSPEAFMKAFIEIGSRFAGDDGISCEVGEDCK